MSDFLWVAEYTDGTELQEVTGEIGFSDIDQSKLAKLRLVPQKENLPSPEVIVSENVRPIFFRRKAVVLSFGGEAPKSLVTVTCLGWQTTVRGVNFKSMSFYLEDGRVILTDDYDFDITEYE